MQDEDKKIHMGTNCSQTGERQILKAAREKQRINSNTEDPQ